MTENDKSKQIVSSLEREVIRFKNWANGIKPESRSGEWECDYGYWNEIHTITDDLFMNLPDEDFDIETQDLILYLLARDNECEIIRDQLMSFPNKLLKLAYLGVNCKDKDARWQLAHSIGENTTYPIEQVESILQRYLNDEDEYVRRRSLLALSRRKSRLTEEYALKAWDSGLEYQRIASLHALYEIKSDRLEEYLLKAEKENGEALKHNVSLIRSFLDQ